MSRNTLCLTFALALACAGCADSGPDSEAPAAEAAAATSSAATDEAAEATATDEPAAASLVPADFVVPVRIETEDFVLVPLGPELVDIDYEAYMSSIEHLQRTFTRSTSWPTEGISDADAMADMENEERRFLARESFAYAVLTPDGLRERGCVYVRPASKAGFDAEVRLWVTQAEFDEGFDVELQAWTESWVADSWPFETVAWPGRAVPWEEWDALPDA